MRTELVFFLSLLLFFWQWDMGQRQIALYMNWPTACFIINKALIALINAKSWIKLIWTEHLWFTCITLKLWLMFYINSVIFYFNQIAHMLMQTVCILYTVKKYCQMKWPIIYIGCHVCLCVDSHLYEATWNVCFHKLYGNDYAMYLDTNIIDSDRFWHLWAYFKWKWIVGWSIEASVQWPSTVRGFVGASNHKACGSSNTWGNPQKM